MDVTRHLTTSILRQGQKGLGSFRGIVSSPRKNRSEAEPGMARPGARKLVFTFFASVF